MNVDTKEAAYVAQFVWVTQLVSEVVSDGPVT